MQLIAPYKKTAAKAFVAALSVTALLVAAPVSAHPHDDDDDKKKKHGKQVEVIINGERMVIDPESSITLNGLRHHFSHGKDNTVVIDIPNVRRQVKRIETHSIADALEEVREALEEIQERKKAAKRKADRQALEGAEKSLEAAIEALESQHMRGEMAVLDMDLGGQVMRMESFPGPRLMLEFERKVIEEAIEELDEQEEDLMDSRRDVVEELAEAREEIIQEIEELQEEADDDDDWHVSRLRALREAELAIAEMEEQHLAAIKQAEKELERARKRLEKRLEEKEKRAERERRREEKRERDRERDRDRDDDDDDDDSDDG